MYSRLKKTLDHYEERNVISKYSKPTEWAHNLVIEEKKNGSLRLTLDPRNLNKYIIRDYELIPKPEEILSKLKGYKYFSVLDCQDGFYQLKLTEESSLLCTFHTPFGKYKFNRLPQGISSSPEVYQRHNIKIFGNLAEVYFDDLIIFAKTKEELDKKLELVLETARKNNVKFNKNKFQYCQTEVQYLGYTVGNDIQSNLIKSSLKRSQIFEPLLM